MASGEGAQLLEVNEGVVAVLSACCDAARSTQLPAGAAYTVVSRPLIFEGKRRKNEETPTEMAVSQLAIEAACRAWSVGRGGARPPLAALGGCGARLKLPAARPPLCGEQVVRNEAAASPHHAYCSDNAPRAARRRTANRWSGDPARASASQECSPRELCSADEMLVAASKPLLGHENLLLWLAKPPSSCK